MFSYGSICSAILLTSLSFCELHFSSITCANITAANYKTYGCSLTHSVSQWRRRSPRCHHQLLFITALNECASQKSSQPCGLRPAQSSHLPGSRSEATAAATVPAIMSTRRAVNCACAGAAATTTACGCAFVRSCGVLRATLPSNWSDSEARHWYYYSIQMLWGPLDQKLSRSMQAVCFYFRLFVKNLGPPSDYHRNHFAYRLSECIFVFYAVYFTSYFHMF